MLCCETYSLHSRLKDATLDLMAVPALFHELSIPGIAWNDIYFASWDPAYLQQLQDATEAAGRKSLALIIEGNLATPDDAARVAQIQLNTQKMHAAAALGIPVVRLNLGKAESDEEDGISGVARCIDAFHQLLPVAKETGVRITIENHGGPSRKADWILQIIKATDPEWVGSCLDFGNWPAQPAELKYEEIEKLAPYAYHTHVKTLGFSPEGEDLHVDYARAFSYVKRAGYKGAVSIEWEGREPSDPVEGVRQSRDLICRHWPEVCSN
jgi:L-ribulose-5-phosphate 3-epimerase